MSIKIKKPIVQSGVSGKASPDEEDDEDIELSDEDIDLEDEDIDLEDEKNLLSDESEVDSADDQSIHSSDDEIDAQASNVERKLQDNPGWADAMSKILKSNKPKRKKTIVLARAKKLNDVKAVDGTEKENLGFEIIKTDGTLQEAGTDVKQEKDVKVEKPDSLPSMTVAQRRFLKKAWQSKGRVKPSALDKDREKALSKIATRGVITLFNTVRQQQKTLSEKLNEAGGLEVKRDKAFKSVSKKEFMETLAKNAKCENVDNDVKSEEDDEMEDRVQSSIAVQSTSNKTGKTWDVLRNNFMMGASMKDWDKEEDGDKDGGKLKKKTSEKTGESRIVKADKLMKGESKVTKGKGGATFSFSMDVDEDFGEGVPASGEESSGGDSEDMSEEEGTDSEGESGDEDEGGETEGSSEFSE